GYVSNFNEAFDKYLNRNGPAYVEREKMTPEEVIALLRSVGGLPVLAHPKDLQGLDELLVAWEAAGLAGMEVYYQDYNDEQIARLKALADRNKLIPLGGSDYHGLGGIHEREPGNIPLPEEPVQRLFTLAKERGVAHRTEPATPN
ncbi:MAG TPA: PHP domain-containing protein, partial [Dehalococcoidia bacterium]|nr:PHP domain-containing protein [Dehalococcoidia bacterium]